MRKYGRYCVNNRRSSIIIENNLQVIAMVMTVTIRATMITFSNICQQPPFVSLACFTKTCKIQSLKSSIFPAVLPLPVSARLQPQSGRSTDQTHSATDKVMASYCIVCSCCCFVLKPLSVSRFSWEGSKRRKQSIGDWRSPSLLLLPGQFQRLLQGSRSGSPWQEFHSSERHASLLLINSKHAEGSPRGIYVGHLGIVCLKGLKV